MRQLVILTLLLLAPVLTLADPPDPLDKKSEPEEQEELKLPPMPIQVKAPTQKLRQYDRIVYVLDVSCSMLGRSLEEAISVTDVFASDGFLASVFTFDIEFVKWGGPIEKCLHKKAEPHGNKCLPSGWARMPTHRDQLRSHLANIKKGGGQTIPGPALTEAIKTAPNGALIVFVSDGEFNQEETTDLVKKAIQWRKKKKLLPVQILVWSTVEGVQVTLVEIAKIGGGGLWRAFREPEKEEEEEEEEEEDWNLPDPH